MRIKECMKYLLKYQWMYSIILLVVFVAFAPALLMLIIYLLSDRANIWESFHCAGFEMVYAISFFCFAAVNFKSSVLINLGNGISRRTFALSSVASAAICSAVSSLCAVVLGRVYSETICREAGYESLYEMLYGSSNPVIDFINELWFNMLLFLAVYLLGTACAAALRRMNIRVRTAVFFILVFGGIASCILNGTSSTFARGLISFSELTAWAMGIGSYSFNTTSVPLKGLLCLIVTNCVFALVSWLFVRKTSGISGKTNGA